MATRTGILGLLLMVGVAGAAAQDTAPETIATQTVVMNFGVVGVAKGQTARLSILRPSAPRRRAFPPDPCKVELSFRLPDGSVLKRDAITLKPDGSGFLDVNAADFEKLTTDGLLLVRGLATIIGPDRKLPPDPCRAGIEVFDDRTQQTRLFVSPSEIRGFNPQPDPPRERAFVPPGADKAFDPQPDPPGLPMIGLTSGESLRLNLANVAADPPGELPPGPVRAAVSFFDAQGDLLGKEKLEVKAGQSQSVGLNGKFLKERRAQIRVQVDYLPPPVPDRGGFPPDPCIPVVTLELVNNETGQSSVILNPGTIRGFNPQPDPPGVIIIPELELER